jgi:hypothetical protein
MVLAGGFELRFVSAWCLVVWEGAGLAGHAGAVLLRKLADQSGLTGALRTALARSGKFPLADPELSAVLWYAAH